MRARHAPDADGGFSLVEMLVVVGIMMVLAAVMAPAIGQYFRNYRIREAQDQVAAAIQRARGRAIARNVNNGVAFVVQSPTRYWIHVEDDVSAARLRDPQLLNYAAPDLGQSTPEDLPRGVRFAATAAECNTNTILEGAAPTLVPNGGWFRFNRLGAWCGGSTCTNPPAPAAATANVLMNNVAGGTLLCLYQDVTGLSSWLLVSPGGRVRTGRR